MIRYYVIGKIIGKCVIGGAVASVATPAIIGATGFTASGT